MLTHTSAQALAVQSDAAKSRSAGLGCIWGSPTAFGPLVCYCGAVDSHDSHRTACIAATIRWARRFRPRPTNLPELIDSVDINPVRYSRLATVIVRRQVVWRSLPYRGRLAPGPTPVRVDSIDPWNPEPSLAEKSRHVCTCDLCRGAKKTTCNACGGLGKTTCRACFGSGRVRSAKTGNPINCKSCRGSGQAKCGTCKSGQIGCSRCEQSGKLEAWLEIEVTQRGHVGVWPRGPHESVHRGLTELSDAADVWPGATRVEFIDRPRSLSASEFGPAAQTLGWPEAIRAPGILPPGDERLDRIVRQVFSVYDVPRTQVRFTFSGATGHLTLLGFDPTPTAECDPTPFDSYRRWVMFAGLTSFVLAFVTLGSYSGRGAYYTEHGFGMVFLASLAAAAATTWSVARWRRRTSVGGARPAGTWDRIPLAMASASALVVALTWLFVGPKLDHASEALAAGDLELAVKELEALESERPNDPDVIKLRLQWLTRRLEQASDHDAIAAILHIIEAEPQLRGQLAAELEVRRMRVLEAAALAGDLVIVHSVLAALLKNAAGPDELRRISLAAADVLLSIASDELDGMRHEPALSLIALVPDPLPEPAASKRRGELLAAGLLARAGLCEERDLICRATALHAATKVDPGESQQKLDVLVSELILQADAAPAPELPPLEQLERLQAMETTLELVATLVQRDDLSEALTDVAEARAQLLSTTPILGQEIAYAAAALGQNRVVDRQEGRWQILDDARFDGAEVYLLSKPNGVVAGAYVVAVEHDTRGLNPSVLNRALALLIHEELGEKSLSNTKKGIRHTRAKAGSHDITLGWDGPELVEAWFGSFKP